MIYTALTNHGGFMAEYVEAKLIALHEAVRRYNQAPKGPSSGNAAARSLAMAELKAARKALLVLSGPTLPMELVAWQTAYRNRGCQRCLNENYWERICPDCRKLRLQYQDTQKKLYDLAERVYLGGI